MRYVRLGFVALGQARFVVLLNPRAAVQPRHRAEDSIDLVDSHDLQRRSPISLWCTRRMFGGARPSATIIDVTNPKRPTDKRCVGRDADQRCML
jgi:hypothetical protein